MKKLIVIGAVAASTVGFGAEASYLAQVYDMTLTLKTGVCKMGKATAATQKYYESLDNFGGSSVGNGALVKGDEAGFRKQATRKIAGVFWGCHCDTIALPRWGRINPAPTSGGAGRYLEGYAFWDQTAKRHFVIPNTVFGWASLNRIGNDFKSVEGTWLFANNLDPQAIFLMGAGFGKASVATLRCRSIINSMSGSFAGFRLPGMDDQDMGSCPYCGVGDCTVEVFCDTCFGFTFNTQLTAAYGTWSLKFNKTAANKLAKTGRITQSYKFKNVDNLPAILARMEEWSLRLDRLGLAVAEDEEEEVELDCSALKVAYNYGVISNATIDENGSVVVGDEEVDEDAYLDVLGYAPFSDTYEAGDDVIIDVADILDSIVNVCDDES